MSRKSTGNVYKNSAERWYARITIEGARRNIPLPTCATEEQARGRLAIMSDLASKLAAAGQGALAPEFLTRAADREGKALEDVKQAVEKLSKHGVTSARSRMSASITFREFATRWTSGELAKQHPDHIRDKRSADDDRLRLARHIYPVVGDLPIATFTLDNAEAVMEALPPDLSAASRRHVAQLMHRVLSMAVFPVRLIPSNPLPRGFLPSPGAAKAKAWLYPDEDRALLSATAIPLSYRILYGFLAREGMRAGEAAALVWGDVDLKRGAIALDSNKTDDPRAWAMSEGTTQALRSWRERCAGAKPQDRVFIEAHGNPVNIDRLAERFRGHLKQAGITRGALFERSANRRPIRIHDLRATFITLALANGRTESWVQDRTGHKSSQMINVYRRAARSAAELELGDLAPLHVALAGLAIGAEVAQPDASAPLPAPAVIEFQAVRDRSQALATTLAPLGSGAERHGGSSPPSCTTAKLQGNSETSEREREEAAPFEGEICASSPSPNPRSAAVATLAGEVAKLAAAGDLEGARVLHETMGRLLVPDVRPGSVLDLDAARSRRSSVR